MDLPLLQTLRVLCLPGYEKKLLQDCWTSLPCELPSMQSVTPSNSIFVERCDLRCVP
jgi:hypothetical protein